MPKVTKRRAVDPKVKALRYAKKLIKNPKNWIKGRYNIDEGFCLLGALDHACSQLGYEYKDVQYTAIKILAKQIKGFNYEYEGPRHIITSYNDAHIRQHAEVMAVLDKAIEKAKTI